METKLRSLFFTGNFPSLINSQGKKSDSIDLLIARAQVQLGKSPQISFPNLTSLSSHLHSNDLVTVHEDPLSDTLRSLLLLNTGQETKYIDSVKPDSHEKIMMLSAALLRIRRPEIAEKTLKSALNQEEEEAGFSLLLACAQFLKGEYEEAAGIVNELVAKYGESGLLLNLYGLSLAHEGNYAKAENLLKKAVDLSRETSNHQDLEMSLRNLIAIKRILNENFEELEQ